MKDPKVVVTELPNNQDGRRSVVARMSYRFAVVIKVRQLTQEYVDKDTKVVGVEVL